MTKITLSIFAIFFALTILTGKSAAATIVDTGVIPCNIDMCQGASYSSTLNPGDKWAARFSLNSATTITDMQIWLNSRFNLNTTFTMSIYADALTTVYGQTFSIPDTTKSFFSNPVLVVDNGIPDNFGNQWQGLSGLNFSLNIGNYWLTMELSSNDNYDGYLPTSPFGALSPVGSYAFFNPQNTAGWLKDPSSNFAFQISGDVTTVPAPSAIYLLLSGLSLFSFRITSVKKKYT